MALHLSMLFFFPMVHYTDRFWVYFRDHRSADGFSIKDTEVDFYSNTKTDLTYF